MLPAAGGSVQGVLAGPAGNLECVLAMPRNAPRGIAVVCHPHPLYGGAMSNKVVYALGAESLAQGLVTARFNFRGIGASQGTYDHARGEVDDALAVVDGLRAQAPGLPLLLAGFSFGAYVALKASAHARPAALVTIAAPFGRYFDDSQQPAHPGCPWLAMHSRDDDTVAFDESAAILRGYDPAPTLISVDGAGHFFHGRLQDIREAVAPFLQAQFAR